jgi:hypothetical protein
MLQGMFGQRLAEHFSLLESSSIVLGPKGKTQVALTRMRMPNGFPGPTPHIPPEKPFRYRCTCVVPTALRAGERGLTVAFIASLNGLPAEFRYSIWSRSRSLCGPPALIRFTSTYRGSFLIGSVTKWANADSRLALHPGTRDDVILHWARMMLPFFDRSASASTLGDRRNDHDVLRSSDSDVSRPEQSPGGCHGRFGGLATRSSDRTAG